MNFRFTCSISILLHIGMLANAQPQKDSLLNLLKQHTKSDTNRVLLLCYLANECTNQDSIIYYANQAKSLSEQLRFDKGNGRALWLLGMANYYKDNIDSSEYYLEQGFKAAQKAKDDYALGKIYNSSANIANYLGNQGYAIELYFKSLSYKERLDDEFGEAVTLNNIANIFSQQQDYLKAREYYSRSYAKRKKGGRLSSALMLHADIADNFSHLKLLDSAKYYLHMGIQFANQSNDPLGILDLYNAEVNYHNAAGNLDSAMYYANLGLETAKEYGSEDRETLFKLILAKQYNGLKNFKVGYEFADEACKMSRKLKRLNYLKEATLQRSLGLQGLGRIEESYQLFKHYKVLSDCTLNNQIKNAALAKDYQYKLEKARLEDENKRIELENKLSEEKALTGFAVVTLVAMSILAYFFYKNFRQKNRSNEELLKQQTEILEKNKEIARQNKRLNEQKQEIQSINESLEEVVARRTHEIQESVKTLTQQNSNLEQFSFIVSHNLRAPVARIKGLAHLMQGKLDQKEQEQIIGMMNLASFDLDVVLGDLTNIINIKSRPIENREKVDVGELFASVVNLLGEDIKKSGAQIKIDVKNANEVLTIKPYFRSILTNLVTNAIKYRSTDRDLVIQIEGSTNDEFHVYSVNDNGQGIDLSNGNGAKIFGLYQRFHTNIEGRGLGLYLVKTQLEAIGGRIDVTSKLDEGTTFTFYLPAN